MVNEFNRFDFIFRPKIKFEEKNGLLDKNKSKEISKMLTEIFEY